MHVRFLNKRKTEPHASTAEVTFKLSYIIRFDKKNYCVVNQKQKE